MKHKSKPSIFAAIVPWALLLILPVSALAAAADGQEIGTPTPVWSEVKSCFEVHLSPGSDRLYTLYEGMLRLYQINPFKMLSATQGDWGAIKEKGCHALVTDDEKKLLVISYKQIHAFDERKILRVTNDFWIYAFDIASGRLLNKAEWGYSQADRVIINNADLVVLETTRIGGDGVPNSRSVHSLNILDINTFKLKRKIADFGKDLHFNATSNMVSAISKVQDRIYLRTEVSLVVLNSQTYQPELSLAARSVQGLGRPESKHPTAFDLPLLSKDFQRLYVMFASEIWDYLTGKHSRFDQTKSDEVFVFDQKTRQSRVEKLNNIPRNALDPMMIAGRHLSRNKNYVLHGHGPHAAGAVVRNINTGGRSFFRQYEAGEAILVEYTAEAKLAGFQLTPDARKYLMMDKGMQIPINDATFAKYYRPQPRNTP